MPKAPTHAQKIRIPYNNTSRIYVDIIDLCRLLMPQDTMAGLVDALS